MPAQAVRGKHLAVGGVNAGGNDVRIAAQRGQRLAGVSPVAEGRAAEQLATMISAFICVQGHLVPEGENVEGHARRSGDQQRAGAGDHRQQKQLFRIERYFKDGIIVAFRFQGLCYSWVILASFSSLAHDPQANRRTTSRLISNRTLVSSGKKRTRPPRSVNESRSPTVSVPPPAF